ncbi:MAG: hypothetical protein HY656_07775 [Acidobacteria bacterium]|nr:hypothetical protein [Acidobacteriota bacterium]
MRSAINLASAPFVPYRRFLLTVGLLAVVTLGATVWVGVNAGSLWQERRTAQSRMRELKAEQARLIKEQERLESELQHPALQALLERVRFMNGLIRQKNLSWAQLFSDLEERLPPRVRILTLSPSLREDGPLQVELQVGGESPQAVIRFLRALEEGQKFREIELHSQTRAENPESDPVVARVSAVYMQGPGQ